MKISIAIPSYEYNGHGRDCLLYSFERMKEQTFKDFDVVISDQSADNSIEELCNEWQDRLDIKYYNVHEDIGNPAKNMNSAVEKAEGDWINILCQDDYLMNEDSLQIIADNIDEEHDWIATGYVHTDNRKNYFNYHAPQLNQHIYIVNTIGTPSCVTIKNKKDLPKFDENLSYAYDCEFYYRFWLKHGKPKLITDVTIANYLWDQSITSHINQDLIRRENDYILKKHGIER